MNDLKYILMRLWISRAEIEELKELITDAKPGCHLAYDPRKAPVKVKKVKPDGIVGGTGFGAV